MLVAGDTNLPAREPPVDGRRANNPALTSTHSLRAEEQCPSSALRALDGCNSVGEDRSAVGGFTSVQPFNSSQGSDSRLSPQTDREPEDPCGVRRVAQLSQLKEIG